MRDRYDAITALGAEVIVVSFEAPARLAMYIEDLSLPFPVVSDPKRAAYGHFGLGPAAFTSLLKPKVWATYIALIRRGLRLRRPTSGVDVRQLGGDFVLDAERRLTYAYPSADPADRPLIEALLMALKTASEASTAERRAEARGA